ncbi:MAG TPA: AAA family ATPase [Candidatus Sulfotelmatobacter sp.]|nr:AAA family ATPase [Candidatus Sulfotelmatobacter sp.]
MTNEAAPASRSSFDYHELLRVASRRRWLLVIPWVAALGLGIAAAFLLKPVYFSSTTMLLEKATQLSGPLGGMVGGGDNSDQQAEVMRDEVQSSLFLRSVITAAGLKSDPATRAWALKQGGHIPGASEDESIESFLIDYLREAITIRRQRGNIFVVTVGDYSAPRARKLAEGVADQFVLSSKAAQLEAVRATQEFSVEQQQIYRRRLDEAESKLEAARRANVATTLTGGVVTASNLQLARSLLDQANSEVDEQKQLAARLKGQFPSEIRENDPAQLSSANATRLVAQIASLERQLATVQLGPTSDGGASARLDISRKVAELETELTNNAARALPTLGPDSRDLLVRYRLAQGDVEARQSRRDFLKDEIDTYEKRTVSGPDQDLAIAHLQEEADNARALYNSFLQQSAAAQISEAFQNAKVSGHFEVLEPANLPRTPGKPNRPVLILLSFLVGGLIGVGSILFVEQHDQSMKNAEEVESLLGLPVVGAIPRVEELQRSSRRSRGTPATPGVAPATPARDRGLLHRLKVESPLGLEFRRIYLNLARTRGRSLPRTIAVTSATRGEGKTTSTACLALTLARELREKILLVDFDLRSPSLHRALGLPGASWGLAQMLQHRNFDERFIRATVQPGLDFLPAGRSERPASELIDTASVEWFLEEASSRYPLVLIDAAPNLAVPDALILGRAVEGVLYVIKAGSTVRKAAEYGVKVQREARENLLGVLLNDVGEILPQYYGYRANTYGYSSEAAGGGDH